MQSQLTLCMGNGKVTACCDYHFYRRMIMMTPTDFAALNSALRMNGVDVCLYGGWGFDFMSGQQSRPHGDVDFFAWQSDRQLLHQQMIALGFLCDQLRSAPFELESADYVRGDLVAGFVFWQAFPYGSVTLSGRFYDAEWSFQPDQARICSLNGAACPVVNERDLVYMSSDFRTRILKRPVEDKHWCDIARVRSGEAFLV